MMDSRAYTSSPDFFEAKYQKKADPWHFSSDSYEQWRYAHLLTALGSQRFRHAYEPGCSIGILTERLAGICESIDAIDFSATASAQAAERCAALPHVRVRCAAVPEQNPPVGYDLLVLSEIGYYFESPVWAGIVSQLVAGMPSGATVLAAHWLGSSSDHILTGDQVHEVLLAEPTLCVVHSERSPMLRLDRLVRA